MPSRKLAALLPIAAIVPMALVPVMAFPVAASAAPVGPAASHACSEQGKITKARVHKIHVAWIPTTWSTSFVAGPASITRTVSISSSTQWTISASFSLDEGLIFASAKEQYGISLARTTGHSASVTYTLNVPKNKTAKMQEFHRGWEMGITQWKVVCVHGFKLSQGDQQDRELPAGQVQGGGHVLLRRRGAQAGPDRGQAPLPQPVRPAMVSG